VAYMVLGAACSAFLLTAEYTDTLLVRKGFTLRTKLAELRKRRRITLGFGLGVHLMLAIPLLNFLCVPIAVVAGTAMGLGYEQWARYGGGAGEVR
ncbi:MAG: EI24 domain-containing protein, partial [Myxococcota bacterium]